MQVARRKGGGGKGRRPQRRRLPVNPFGQVGSPIRDLISAAEWDRRYGGIEAELMEAAKVEPGNIVPGRRPVSRQRWFAANVKRKVGRWLELAGQPAVREVEVELGELYTRLWDALKLETPEAAAAAADAYEALSPPARDALRGGTVLRRTQCAPAGADRPGLPADGSGRAGSAPEDGGRRYPVEVKRAMRYRDGLMLALLAYHPLRLANLASLQLGHELRDDGSGWWLELEPAAIKNRRPYLVPLARDLNPPLDRYLRYWRPRLAGPTAAARSTRCGSPARAGR